MAIEHVTPPPRLESGGTIDGATEKPRRWTPSRIRKATPYPKPKGEIAKVIATNFGGARPDLASRERRLLRWIVDHLDILDIATDAGWTRGPQAGAVCGPNGVGTEVVFTPPPTRWAVFPAPDSLFEHLEAFEADLDDLEDGADAEDDGIGGEAMVSAGMAYAFTRYSGDYVEQEKAAITARAGVHAHDCEMPWGWRARKSGDR